jgi:predicted ATP-grasp superfamily ATP-dependent carboligase
MPPHVEWKIVGNREYHQELISLFGQNHFIDVPITKMKEHVQDENKPFDFLSTLSEKHIIIPTDFQSLKFVSQNKKSFGNHIVCPIMDFSLLMYLDDKLNIQKISESCGVQSPREFLPAELSTLPAHQRLVIKPNLGDGSTGVFISDNKQHGIDYYEQLTPQQKQTHLIQQYIDGDDFYYYAMCSEGKIVVSSIIIPGRYKYFGTYFADDQSVDENAKKIIGHYKFTGPISIDYRIDKKTKEVYLIEINPRNGNNGYLFNVAGTNWLFELARLSENLHYRTGTHKIIMNKWFCQARISLLFFFYRLKLYKLWSKLV